MKKKLSLFLSVILALSITLIGCSSNSSTTTQKAIQPTNSTTQQTSTVTQQTNSAPQQTNSTTQPTTEKIPKYVFMFIGDGMASVQTNAASVYLSRQTNTVGSVAQTPLNFTRFPASGSATTYDSTSFCPDSASTATSLSSGIKTLSGVVGYGNSGTTVDKNVRPEKITEKFKKAGMKVGIVSSVTLTHATPAAYYSAVESRGYYYEILSQLIGSGFDYFAGGATGSKDQISEAEEKAGYKARPEATPIDSLKANGFTVTTTKDEFNALDKSSEKVYAQAPETQDSGSMKYALDTTTDDISLTEFVSKGIEVLENDKGFFMLVESGKVDWACHANDALSAIQDTVEFDKAIGEAVEFMNAHPDETLIIVTGDHETGGMTIGQATTGYDTAFAILDNQKCSYVEFEKIIDTKKEAGNYTFDLAMKDVTEKFGLKLEGDEKDPMLLSAFQKKNLELAFDVFMNGQPKDMDNEEFSLLYGGYNPFTITITHILNNKAGIGWTSYSHTGVPVPVFANGVGSEKFIGSYDNTDIFKKIVEICKV